MNGICKHTLNIHTFKGNRGHDLKLVRYHRFYTEMGKWEWRRADINATLTQANAALQILTHFLRLTDSGEG